MYINAKQIKEQLGITSQTLYNWRKAGKIKYKEINSRNFLYDISSLELKAPNRKKKVFYARVSNSKQKEDLIRQERILRDFMTSSGFIVEDSYSDIASGMNENRKEFNRLLNDITSGEIDTVFITYKDRLTRFGFGYIEHLCSLFDTKIVIINATTEEDFQSELTQDIITIIHHFSMKMYSNRRKILKSTMDMLENIKED